SPASGTGRASLPCACSGHAATAARASTKRIERMAALRVGPIHPRESGRGTDNKKARPLPAGLRSRLSGEGTVAILALGYQVRRGPTNHWVSPSATLTSALRPQFRLNFHCAPKRP